MKFTQHSNSFGILVARILLPFFLVSGSYLNAQTTIYGMVMDNINDMPLVGAHIEISGTKEGTYSNEDGSFTLVINEKLPIKISVTSIGYELRELKITKPSNNLLVSMVPGALVGQETVITASRKEEKEQEAPSAMDVIEAKTIKADAVVNPFISLRNRVGLDFTQTGVSNGNITLRGRNSMFQTETFVIADYRNLIIPGLGGIDYNQQPIDPIDIERIEIVKGPGSALYGPGVEAGIVHFISKNPFDEQGTSISVGGGTRNTIQASFRHANVTPDNKFGYKITGYYRQSNDWEIDTTDAVERARLESFRPNIVSSLNGEVVASGTPDYNLEMYGVTGTLIYNLNEKLSITGLGGWAINKGIFRTSEGEGYNSSPRPFAQLRVNSDNFFGQVFWSSHQATDGRVFLYSSGLTNIFVADQYEGQFQYNLDVLNEKLNFVVGADYRLNTMDTKGTLHGKFENMDSYDILGAYAQFEYNIGKRVDIVGATRYDQFFALDQGALSPRFGLVYRPTPKHTLRATYNRAYGAPAGLNLFADFPLASNANFNTHLLGGAEPLTFNDPQTTSFVPGIQPANGVGMDLKSLYNLISLDLLNQGAVPKEIMDYLLSSVENIEGISPGALSQPFRPRNQKLELSNSHVFEIGYKGLFYDKIGITIDAYYNIRQNLFSTPFQASPVVFQPTLGQDLENAILAGLNPDGLEGIGLSVEAIANMYGGYAEALAFDGQTGTPNPLGVISSDQAPSNASIPNLDVTYYNIDQIEYFGLDASIKYYFTGDFNVYGNVSWLSQSYFEDVQVGSAETGNKINYSLNVPDLKLKLGIDYFPEFGPNGFVMVRYQNEWQSEAGLPWSGPVEAYTVVDAGFGYSFENNVSINCTVTNLLMEKYRGFFGSPRIGRQFMAKMYYHF